jgi:hypothetical protein
MIDDGLGFQLVPWRPALDPARHLGEDPAHAIILAATAQGGIANFS